MGFNSGFKGLINSYISCVYNVPANGHLLEKKKKHPEDGQNTDRSMLVRILCIKYMINIEEHFLVISIFSYSTVFTKARHLSVSEPHTFTPHPQNLFL